VAIDVFSDSFAHALLASQQVLPLNAPGTSGGDLPPPVYCPGLSGPIGAKVRRVLERLPGRVCQRNRAETAYTHSLA
jgi:hypothetical protein